VIAAGAIVIRDVPPMSLVGGNPARIIRTITEADVAKYREA
jgi:maltose O-acetyltransferase